MSESADTRGRIPLPLALVVMAIFLGAMKIQSLRPIGARSLALILPLGVAWAGIGKLRDAHPHLLRAGIALGALIVLWAELMSLRVFFGVEALDLESSVVRSGALLLGLGSLGLEAIAARRSLRVRISAWLGIALGFSAYLAGVARPEPDAELGLVFVAGVIGLWSGGLAGLAFGALGARLAAPPAKPPTAQA